MGKIIEVIWKSHPSSVLWWVKSIVLVYCFTLRGLDSWYEQRQVKWSESRSVVSDSCVWLFATPWTVHGILQARVLEWVGFPFSRGSSKPRDGTRISCIACRFFTSWATEPKYCKFLDWFCIPKKKSFCLNTKKACNHLLANRLWHPCDISDIVAWAGWSGDGVLSLVLARPRALWAGHGTCPSLSCQRTLCVL